MDDSVVMQVQPGNWYDEELRRIKRRFDIEQTAIMDGRFFHPSIPAENIQGGLVADLYSERCIWIKQLAQSHFLDVGDSLEAPKPLLVGFGAVEDIGDSDRGPLIDWHCHDDETPIDVKWHAKCHVVNVRFPLKTSDDQVDLLVREALKLLRPGGYLQWLDCDLMTSTPIPACAPVETVRSSVRTFQERHGVTPSNLGTAVTALRIISGFDSSGSNSASKIADNCFDAVEHQEITTGTQVDREKVGGAVSLEMRNNLIRKFSYINQIDHLYTLQKLRSGVPPEEETELRTQLDRLSDLDDALGVYLAKSLEEFRFEQTYHLIIARKAGGAADSL